MTTLKLMLVIEIDGMNEPYYMDEFMIMIPYHMDQN
jgi:hypothetical protein